MLLAIRRRHGCWQALLSGLLLAMLVGCGSAPPRPSGTTGIPPVTPRPGPAPSAERDGPDARPPADLSNVPDAEPRIEPIRNGGPNRPYETLGRDYVPITSDRAFTEKGLASWYGKKFHGRRTASGETYNMYAMTAAHPTLPIPSYVRVLNPANQREVVVRINDRGPFHPGRIIDLSYTAAYKLGVLKGVAPVELTRITFDEIRAGTWRKGAPAETVLASVAKPAASEAPIEPPLPAPPPVIAVAAPAPAGEASQAPDNAAASVAPARGFWVQLGVFRQREGADGFYRRVAADLEWLGPLLAVFAEPTSYRLQAGPYASRDEAQGVARRVREALNLVPVVVERR
ncbi:MAG TPA: septal ring lytic transglycosylase RlpA family protein [Albitalea sp.]|uniref:septal ring lytic transglycosylase RlpA family protein n=1 Tax=Piscinibacter sp. TaxID=1903157 RepID=UPI002ED31ABD